jgi:hypothetical protein
MEQPESASIAKLAAALVKAQGEFPEIAKDKTGKISGKSKKTGKYYDFEYKYADLPAVISAVTPALNKNGLAVIQIPMDGDLVTTILHESGERISGNMKLPENTSPQELGSWITYLRRYSLCAMLGIAADEDDDAGSAEAGHQERGTEPPPPEPPPPDPAPEPSEHEITVRKLFADGMAALLGNVDNPEAEMKTRMSRILGGMGFEKAGEITARYQQEEFYNTVKDTIAEIRKQYPSPVS